MTAPLKKSQDRPTLETQVSPVGDASDVHVLPKQMPLSTDSEWGQRFELESKEESSWEQLEAYYVARLSAFLIQLAFAKSENLSVDRLLNCQSIIVFELNARSRCVLSAEL